MGEEMGIGWWRGVMPVSDDQFLYARCSVVASGRDVFEAVLADPRRMPRDRDFKPLIWIAPDAWERMTDREADFDSSVSYETFSNEAGWPPGPPDPEVPRPQSPGE